MADGPELLPDGDAGDADDVPVYPLGGQAAADVVGAHQIAVGVFVNPLGMAGQVGDAGDEGQGAPRLPLPAGHHPGAEGVGGDHRVGPPGGDKLLQFVQEQSLKQGAGVGGQILGQLVVEVEQPAATGHQQVEALIHGLGGVGHGLRHEVQHLHLRPGERPQQLLAQGLGGRPVAHAEFSGENQNIHGVPSFSYISIKEDSLENLARILKKPLRISNKAFIIIP